MKSFEGMNLYIFEMFEKGCPKVLNVFEFLLVQRNVVQTVDF